MDYKCKNCGGPLHFDPALGKLKCDFCDSVYELSEYEKVQDADQSQKAIDKGFDKATDDTTEVKEDLRLYKCPHCGAEVVTDKDTAATTCVFCQTPLVLEENTQGAFRPEAIIPFEISPKQIEDIYEQYIQNKPFYPEEYSKANVIGKIKSIYLPFWLNSMTMRGNIRASGEHTTTFPMGKWIVTNHDVYELVRQGTMDFDKIPSIASSKTPRDAMDALEPFDYSKLKAYDPGYLPGFLASKYDIDASGSRQASAQRAETTINDSLANTLGGYEGIVVEGGGASVASASSEYALLPAYLLFMDYDNDEDKLIAINGQTGKIAGNIPVDAKKRNRFFLRHFLVIFVILLVVLLAAFMILDIA